jgi:hypothetical protein
MFWFGLTIGLLGGAFLGLLAACIARMGADSNLYECEKKQLRMPADKVDLVKVSSQEKSDKLPISVKF